MNLRTRLSTKMLLGLSASLLAAGCGGGGGAKPITTPDFCMMWATAVCQISASCSTSLTSDTCQTAAIAQCQQQATTATAAGVRLFTIANVSKAVGTATMVFKKTSPITPTDLANVQNTFSYVFQGKVPKNMSCTSKYDCAGGEDSVICDKGVCATSTTKASGVGCSDPGAVCDAASYCTMGGTLFYTCDPKGARGAICNADTPCIDSLRCAAGHCGDRVLANGACASDSDCVSTSPYCDLFAGGVCSVGLQFAAGSNSCKDFFSPPTAPTTDGAAGTSGGDGAAGTGGAAGVTGTVDAASDTSVDGAAGAAATDTPPQG
jgi:hypothetical protein